MINSYEFGKIVVNGEEYHRDIVIFQDRVKSNWWRKEGHKLSVEDIKDVLDFKPEAIVIGKGAYGFMKVTEDLKKFLSEKGILLKADKTDAACKIYNEMVKNGRKVAAAFHLTC